MSNKEEQLKKELLEELGSKKTDTETLSGLFSADSATALGEDFTAQVMQKIRATKRPSPIVRISRIDLPLTACAAALVICLSLGVRHFAPRLGTDTVNAESDSSAIQTSDTYKSKEYGEPMAPPPESAENPAEAPEGVYDAGAIGSAEDDLTCDALPEISEEAEESAEADMEMPQSPSAAAGTSASTSAGMHYGGDYADYLFTVNNSAAISNVETFRAASRAEAPTDTEAEIILLMSRNYAEYTLFGSEYTEGDTGNAYELITVNCAVDKEAFLDEMEEYLTDLSDQMSASLEGEDWSIEIKTASSLPDALTPDTQIKIIKEQETE